MEVKEAFDNIDETFYGDQLYMIDHKSMKQLQESPCCGPLHSNPNITLQSLIQSKKYDVIVLVSYPIHQCITYNEIAHHLDLKFICCDVCSVFTAVC
eukprot:527873_1